MATNVNTSELRKQAKALDEAATKLNNSSVKTINNANAVLAKAWNGKSSSNFQKYMKDLNDKLATNVTSMRNIAQTIIDACASIEKAEAQAKASVNRMK